jgi:hypothetical protein
MTGTVLREHWLQAIGVAGIALSAAARVESLSAEELSRHQHLLASERHWLGTVEWSTVTTTRIPTESRRPSPRASPRRSPR